ncbi:MAG: hypothetical protein JNG90_00135 [Planctomycetaceae bacterium]|nr:hypothetical protein [Planctomycetaceae bacterium]
MARQFLVRCSVVGALLLTLVAPSPADEAIKKSAAQALVTADRILVIAHRGDSKVAPENTLPAFQSAVDVGSDLVELDYVHTKDGVPLVIHDDTLDRTTNARQIFGGEKIPVASKTLQELAPLDAGEWFGKNFRGTRLPTLDQSLDVIQRGSVTLIERKKGDAKTCYELLRSKDLLDEVVVQAFDWDFLADFHQLAPHVALGALGHDELTDAKIAAVKRTGATVVGWQQDQLDQAGVNKLHDAGYRVWAWTVDNLGRADELADMGVNGIITNIPKQVKALDLAYEKKAAAVAE